MLTPARTVIRRAGTETLPFAEAVAEALAPARVAQLPAQFALGLGVRGAAGLGSHHDQGFAREQPREPARKALPRQPLPILGGTSSLRGQMYTTLRFDSYGGRAGVEQLGRALGGEQDVAGLGDVVGDPGVFGGMRPLETMPLGAFPVISTAGS